MAQIIHRYTGEVIFEAEDLNLMETLSLALKNNISLSYADLSNQNLNGINLENADLRYANLCYSDFSSIDDGAFEVDGGVYDFYYQSNLSNANLSNADLEGSNLYDTKFYNSNFSEANLTKASLFVSDLRKCNFKSANLSNADVFGASLNDAILENASLNQANFSGADLESADLTGANLYQTNFTEAILKNTIFLNTRLHQTIFGLTNLSECKDLDKTIVENKCIIDFETIKNSPTLSHAFLNKLGISEQILDYVHDLTNESPIKLFPVFLSHSWSNKEFARKLYDDLSKKQIHCWFDERKTKTGDKIISVVAKGINDYDKMILVCSKESLTSWWVEREIERILEKERKLNNGKKEEDKVNLLIPIALDNYVYEEWDSHWATEIKRYIIGDFANWKDSKKYSVEFKKLTKSLEVNPITFTPPSYLSKSKNK